MTEYSYDVTRPQDGIIHPDSRMPSKRRSWKIFAILGSVLLIILLISTILYLLATRECSAEERGIIYMASSPRRIDEENVPKIDLRMSVITTNPPKLNDLDKFTCKSTECLHTAASMISKMDFSKEPCEDFHDYACGKLAHNDKLKYSDFDVFSPENFRGNETLKFLEKFQIFYDSCVDHENNFDYEERIRKTKTLLENIASFQLSGHTDDNFNLTDFIASMILYNSMPLFDVDIDTDHQNSNYILRLLMPDQTSLKLHHWSTLVETKRKCMRQTEKLSYEKSLNMTILYNMFLLCQKNYMDYLSSISTSIQELGFFSNLTEKEAFVQIRDIRVFVEFEILSKFDEIPLPPNLQEQTLKRQYEDVKIGQLEKHYPLIQWEHLFRILTNNNSKISNETKIQMYNKEYFKEIFHKISSLKHSKLNNAFLAIFVSSLFENTVLPVHRHSREKFCKDQSKELMSDITNYLYKKKLDRIIMEKNNEAVEKLFKIIKDEFRKSLENREWLDENSKSSIIKKLDNIQLEFFHNADIESEEKFLENTYKDLEVLKNEYQINHFRLLKFRRRSIFSLHDQKISPENTFRYFVDTSNENPEYLYANNMAYIPYGFSRRIDFDLPGYMISAQVGFQLAKIIGRAFDRIGIQYGVDLTPNCNNSYNYFADQTRDMLVLMNPLIFGKQTLNFNLNNDLSESERISDNTAMRIMLNSFDSFEGQPILPWISQDFSKKKIFLLYLTQGFCRKMSLMQFMVQSYENPILPPQFRVKNILGNSEEFLDIFKCRPGSGMSVSEDFFQFPYLSKIDDDVR